MTEKDDLASRRAALKISAFHFDEGYAAAKLGMLASRDNPYVEQLEPVAYYSWIGGFLKALSLQIGMTTD